jgi:hypothetical protein
MWPAPLLGMGVDQGIWAFYPSGPSEPAASQWAPSVPMKSRKATI